MSHASQLRVLYVLSNWSYPGQEGLHIQTGAILRRMSSDSQFQVKVVAFIRDVKQIDLIRLKTDFSSNVTFEFFQTSDNYPKLLIRNLLLPNRFNSVYNHICSTIGKDRYDVLHLEGIGLAPLISTFSKGLPVVMATIDAWSLRQTRLAASSSGIKRLGFKVYAWITSLVERRFFPDAAAVHLVSCDDAAHLSESAQITNVRVIPVALLQTPSPAAYSMASAQPVVTFWGDIGVPYLKAGLVWFLKNVRPHISTDFKLVVLGRRSPDQELLAISDSQVEYKTWVDDIDEVLQNSAAVVLPDSSGSGMKNRTLHAMACGVPVVGTSFAFEGTGAVGKDFCLCSDDPMAFANHVNSILKDENKRLVLGHAGRQFVINYFGLDSVYEQWRSLYVDAAKKTATRRE